MKSLKQYAIMNRREMSFMLSAVVMISLPFLGVRFVPATDLPQHLAQVRLFNDILQGKSSDIYSISWWGANVLVYMLLGINWMFLAPIAAGKALMVELAIAWVAAIFVLAKRRDRITESALLASLFVFNASLYWGFVNFILGWPVFVAWYVLVVAREGVQSPVRRVFIVFFLSALLFLAHALWLAVGILELFVADARHRTRGKALALQMVGLLPLLAYCFIWYQRISHERLALTFDTAGHWNYSPWERLNPSWILDAALGGLRGPTEAVVLLGVLAWVAVGLYTHRDNLRTAIDKNLLWSSVLLGAIVFLAPDKFLNTILFASRWMPPAIILLLLALPAPRLPDAARISFAAMLVVILAFSTALQWYQFDKNENSGLSESLSAVSPRASVLGLDFIKESTILCGNPFIQTVAYAQVLQGGRLGFSFAEHHSGIVVTDSIGEWTPALEWEAERVSFQDLAFFDFTLVNATDEVHRHFSSLPALQPVTTEGRWRLYRCVHNLGLKGSVFSSLRD